MPNRLPCSLRPTGPMLRADEREGLNAFNRFFVSMKTEKWPRRFDCDLVFLPVQTPRVFPGLYQALAAFVLLAISCQTSKIPDGDNKWVVSHKSALTSAAEQPLILTQTSLLPGTTSVDLSAAVFFRTAQFGKRDILAALFARNATFLSDEGETFSASAEITSAKMPPDGVLVAVTPLGTMKEDHWYTLIIKEDADLQLSNGTSAEDLSARKPGIWKSDFFTGSAPHVIRAQTPLGAKDGSYVHVTFSEPIQISSLDISQFLSIDGRTGAKCVLLGGVCASSTKGVMTEQIDVAPLGPLGQFQTLTFAIGGTLPGSGRTASQGLPFAASRVPTIAASGGMVRISSSSKDWFACDDNASLCWQAHD
jgi:hypothetical protein